MTNWSYLRGKSRHRLIGSGFTAVALGRLAVWSFVRCAGLPDDRCLDKSIRPNLGGTLSSADGCLLCYCDASGEVHCMPRACSPDGGVRADVPE